MIADHLEDARAGVRSADERSAENVRYWLEQARLYLPYMPELAEEALPLWR